MKHKIWFGIFIILAFDLTGCRTSPNHAEKIETKMDLSAKVSGNENVGVQKGDMVVQEKSDMSERLRDLQNTVYSLEDQTFGTRKLGSFGLYGELKSCRRKLASRAYGGPGTLVWTEPLDRVTDKEAELKVGLDENKDLVGVDREYLLDRVRRFSGYKQILQKRFDEFTDQVQACHAELADREFDAKASAKVVVREAPKSSVDRVAIHAFVCGYVHGGASLRTLVLGAFEKGWLSLAEFRLDQNLLAPTLKDSRGVTRPNVFLFNGWKLAYDHGPVTLADLLGGDPAHDSHLEAWSFDRKSEVADAVTCLPGAEGTWTP